jgi:hypothetical protein
MKIQAYLRDSVGLSLGDDLGWLWAVGYEIGDSLCDPGICAIVGVLIRRSMSRVAGGVKARWLSLASSDFVWASDLSGERSTKGGQDGNDGGLSELHFGRFE